MPTLLLATGNPGKAAEFRALLDMHLDLSQISLLTPHDWPMPLPEVLEYGETFAENALLKARTLAKATGLVALADDSGLCVDALGGRPGLHSARWAGAEATDSDRNDYLLAQMQDLPLEQRQAHYVCVVALAAPDGQFATAEGLCSGLILMNPIGDGGFGYDPLFFLPEFRSTMAELTADEKNRISHRAQAITNIVSGLPKLLRVTV